MAVFTTNKEDAGANGLKPKPLSPEARAIVGKLSTPKRPQEGENTASDLPSDLDNEVQAAGGGQGASDDPASVGGVGSTTSPPYTLFVRWTTGGGLSAGADDKKEKAAEVKKNSTAGKVEHPGGAAGAVTTSARSSSAVYLPTPSTGMPRPDGTPAPEPKEDKRPQTGYGHNTPTDHAYSTQQIEDKARRFTAELTGMHVKYRATPRQTPPGGIIRPAPWSSAPGATWVVLVQAAMADLRELARAGSLSAATALGSFEPDVRDMAMWNAIKNGIPSWPRRSRA